jgi:hypothetical protein
MAPFPASAAKTTFLESPAMGPSYDTKGRPSAFSSRSRHGLGAARQGRRGGMGCALVEPGANGSPWPWPGYHPAGTIGHDAHATIDRAAKNERLRAGSRARGARRVQRLDPVQAAPRRVRSPHRRSRFRRVRAGIGQGPDRRSACRVQSRGDDSDRRRASRRSARAWFDVRQGRLFDAIFDVPEGHRQILRRWAPRTASGARSGPARRSGPRDGRRAGRRQRRLRHRGAPSLLRDRRSKRRRGARRAFRRVPVDRSLRKLRCRIGAARRPLRSCSSRARNRAMRSRRAESSHHFLCRWSPQDRHLCHRQMYRRGLCHPGGVCQRPRRRRRARQRVEAASERAKELFSKLHRRAHVDPRGALAWMIVPSFWASSSHGCARSGPRIRVRASIVSICFTVPINGAV